MNNGFLSRIPPVTKNLIIINVLVWGAMMLLPQSFTVRMTDLFALHSIGNPDFYPWQLFTYMFLHSTQSFFHVFFNMFTLFMFGSTLEYVLGSKRYLFYYITCGIGAALIQEGVMWALASNALQAIPEGVMEMQPDGSVLYNPLFREQVEAYFQYYAIVTVGASGAIYGLLLAFGVLFPNRPLYIMFIPIPVKAKYMVVVWTVLELSLGIGGVQDSVAHFCHLGGMLVGLLMILYWKKKGLAGGGFY